MADAPTPRDWSSHPPYVFPGYKSTLRRGPRKPLVPLKATLSEMTGPVYGHDALGPLDDDLTRNARHTAEPLGERIVVTGRVLDEAGRPVRNTLSRSGRPTLPGATSIGSTGTMRRSIRTSSAPVAVSPTRRDATAS